MYCGKFALLMKRHAAIPTLLLALVLAAGTAMAQERLAIVVDVANIRAGPGTDRQVIGKMEKNTPVMEVSRQGEWILFEDFKQAKGWIHESLVGDISAVITKKSMCNIRSSPGTDHEVVFQAEAGVPFRVLDSSGEWLHIEHSDGDTGWIHESLVW